MARRRTGSRPTGKYYAAYDDRFRRVYEAGFPFWSSDPGEQEETIRVVEAFLDEAGASPEGTRVLEVGCGEGHLAAHLAGAGFGTVGVDLSPAALARARERPGTTSVPLAFVRADAARGLPFADGSFDLTIDNFFLHMLVVDEDRQRYLAEVARVTARRGRALFHENYTDAPVAAPVRSLEDFARRTGFDGALIEDRAVFVAGAPRRVRLPRLPSRPLDEEGHRAELGRAGLEVDTFRVRDGRCAIHARVRPQRV